MQNNIICDLHFPYSTKLISIHVTEVLNKVSSLWINAILYEGFELMEITSRGLFQYSRMVFDQNILIL